MIPSEDITTAENMTPAQRLSLILDNVNDIVFLLDVKSEEEYRFLFANPAFLTATGLCEEQVVGKRIQDVIPTPAHALVLGRYAEAVRERRAVEWSETSVYPAGERIGAVRVVPIFNAQGVCTQLLGTVHDITAQRHAAQRAEQLLAVSDALGGATSTEEVAEVIIEAALPIFQATVGLIALLSENGSQLDCLRIVGVPPAEAERWRSFPADAPVPLADAVRDKRLVVLITDEAHNAAYPEMAEERAQAGDGALMAAPLLVGERCIGGIGLICPPEYCRDEEQQTFLWTLASQCALALERARLFDAERQAREAAMTEIAERRLAEGRLASAYRREVILNQIGQTIRATRDPNQIQATAVRALGETLQADRVYFSLLDLALDTSWVGQDFRRPDLPSLAGQYRISDYQVDPAAFYPDGKTLVLPDVNTWDWPEPLAEAIRSVRVRSAVNVPLFDGNVLVGTLAVAMADEPRAWTDEEVSLVETVAVQTRAALDAARVQEREHRIAEQLAQALQPPTPASVPGLTLAEFYRPAWEDQGVGGDFFDVFSTDKGVTFLVVGDLSGKGLAAASQVAMVRHMLRFALYNGRSVSGPVGSLNDTLADNDLLSGFSTLFVGRYDAESRLLIYVNAGQDAGLILRAATGEVEALPPTGPVLGAVGGARYTEGTVTLKAGDALALYTDGLTEAGPTRTDLLTSDGVADLLRGLTGLTDPQQIVERLMAGVDNHAGSGVRDDQCLLVGIVSG